jgi:hypothetical protein
MVNPAGIISTAISQAGSRYSGDGGLVAQAQASPGGLFIDKSLNVYFADGSGNRIREILTANAVQPAAATATFSPAAGAYGASQTITIADTTPGAQIFFTLDGSVPFPGTSALYTGPLTLIGTVKLSAIAIAPGLSQSKAATATYNMPSAAKAAIPANALESSRIATTVASEDTSAKNTAP